MAGNGSWLYRVRPSVGHGPFSPISAGAYACDWHAWAPTPNPLRWDPVPLPTADAPRDFAQVRWRIMAAGFFLILFVFLIWLCVCMGGNCKQNRGSSE